MNVARIERSRMAWNWKPWGRRVRDTQSRTQRVETATNRIELDIAEKVARATLVTDRVERAAIEVLLDHEAVMVVAARERQERQQGSTS